jgi:5-methylcytosine-specific restriction endonuclease McrA
MKACRLCGRERPATEYVNSKGKPSSTLTHKRRAEDYGVEHVAYSRTEIFKRWHNACAYCGSWATHLDHVEPLSRGGADVESNMVPACAPCNLSKGAKTLAEWSETFGPEPPPF